MLIAAAAGWGQPIEYVGVLTLLAQQALPQVWWVAWPIDQRGRPATGLRAVSPTATGSEFLSR